MPPPCSRQADNRAPRPPSRQTAACHSQQGAILWLRRGSRLPGAVGLLRLRAKMPVSAKRTDDMTPWFAVHNRKMPKQPAFIAIQKENGLIHALPPDLATSELPLLPSLTQFPCRDSWLRAQAQSLESFGAFAYFPVPESPLRMAHSQVKSRLRTAPQGTRQTSPELGKTRTRGPAQSREPLRPGKLYIAAQIMRHRAPEIVSIDAGVMKRWRCIIYAAIRKAFAPGAEKA